MKQEVELEKEEIKLKKKLKASFDRIIDKYNKNKIDLTYFVDKNTELKFAKMENKEMVFKLSPEQVKKLEEWQGHIKAIYGEYGHYKYIFESGGGLGFYDVKVYSYLANTSLELTEDDVDL
jgi:hypothetical protein